MLLKEIDTEENAKNSLNEIGLLGAKIKLQLFVLIVIHCLVLTVLMRSIVLSNK